MNNKYTLRILMVLVVVIVGMSASVEAQETNSAIYTESPVNIKLALLLARTCVAEIGFDGDLRECILMWGINQKNALRKGRSLKRQTILFNSYWKCRLKKYLNVPGCRMIRASRPWIKHLSGPNRPKYWPSTMSWEFFRDKWLAIEEKAIEFVGLTYDKWMFFDCPLARDYGAPGEIPLMKRMEKMRCLNRSTRQRYWRVKRKKVNK